MKQFIIVLVVLTVGLIVLSLYARRDPAFEDVTKDSVEKTYDRTTSAIKDTLTDINKTVYE